MQNNNNGVVTTYAWLGAIFSVLLAVLLNKRLTDQYFDNDRKSAFAFMFGVFTGLAVDGKLALDIQKTSPNEPIGNLLTGANYAVGLELPVFCALAGVAVRHVVPALGDKVKTLCFSKPENQRPLLADIGSNNQLTAPSSLQQQTQLLLAPDF